MLTNVRALALGCALAAAGCAHHDVTGLREPDAASRLRVADTAAANGQTDIALSMYAAAAASAPDDADLQARYVGLLIRTGQLVAADQAIKPALARNPRDKALRRWLAVLRLENDLPTESLQITDDLLTRAPRNISLLNDRGMALDLLGQHVAAQESYRKALADSPGDARTVNNLAVSLMLSGKPRDAVALLMPIAQAADASPRVRNNLAIAQAASGNVAAAGVQLSGSADAGDIRALATALGAPPS